jgi:hypothetical protein
MASAQRRAGRLSWRSLHWRCLRPSLLSMGLVLVLGGCSSAASTAGPADASVDRASSTDGPSNLGDGSVPSDAPAGPGDGSSGAETGTPDSGASTILIADQFNNRVIEIDRQGAILWTFGDGASAPGPSSVVAPNDAERLPDGDTLICGTGAPDSASAAYGVSETACASAGCPDNRVLLVDSSGTITWQYGQNAGVSGAGPDQLAAPVAARMLPNGNVLITDQGNDRIIEVTPQKSIAWMYPADVDAASPLSDPNSAERLGNGDTLIADEGNDRVVEIDPSGTIVWQYPTTPDPTILSGPAFANRLANGDTLITDSGNSRVIEVTSAQATAWTYVTNTRPSSFPQPFPTHAVRLTNGDTLISDQLNDQVIEVDALGAIVFSYGAIQLSGSEPGQLNTPYDAKVVGDYTGLTAPQ